MYNPPHAGLILREYIGGYSVTEIAERLGVTRATLSRILNGKQGITAEMSVRLSHLLGINPRIISMIKTKVAPIQATLKSYH